jgi:hypothetical protein
LAAVLFCGSLAASVLDVGLAAVTIRLRYMLDSGCAVDAATGASIPLYANSSRPRLRIPGLSAWTLPFLLIRPSLLQRSLSSGTTDDQRLDRREE